MLNKNPTTLIIPAAGFGRRAVDKTAGVRAKELLPNPRTGRPLIEKSLRLAQGLGAPVVVITRAEKTDLIAYLQAYQSQQNVCIETLLIQPSREWPDSILQSEAHWGERNVLILPDTDFAPDHIVPQLAHSEADIAAALFSLPSQPQNLMGTFGCFAQTAQGEWWHAEKPQHIPAHLSSARPWGLLAWRKAYGRLLFQQMLSSTFDHEWRRLPSPDGRPPRFAGLELEHFTDLTRAEE